ncbi:BgTH12-06999 [Blumeria graminis f. sp. triticale]|nr:BgTH12-06999 [Blumeria graminis f. sp. triticale]
MSTSPPSATQDITSVCPNCGVDQPGYSSIATQAQSQIQELRSQVELLTSKATAAVDKVADYEDKIRDLRAEIEKAKQTKATGPEEPIPEAKRVNSMSAFGGYRITSFLSSRIISPTPKPAPAPESPPSPSTAELAAALTREQELRKAAEGKLSETSNELEELSTQLFKQANEMVAAERKARTKLESRVEILEKRDIEKRQRLEQLEKALLRIERVRGLLK